MTREEKVIYDELILSKIMAEEVKNKTANNEDEFWEAKKQIEVADSFFDYLITKYGGDYPESVSP